VKRRVQGTYQIHEEYKDKIIKYADKERRSFNNMLEFIIEKGLKSYEEEPSKKLIDKIHKDWVDKFHKNPNLVTGDGLPKFRDRK